MGIIAVLRDDKDKADETYTAFKPLAGKMWISPGIDHLLGLLSRTMGKPQQAAAHFDDAVAFSRNAPHRPELARTLYDYADTLLLADGPHEFEKPMSLLEASHISSELGMSTLEKGVTALRDRVEARNVVASTSPHGLTPREVEVLRLVASGMSNPDIGEELHISLNTVKRHLSSIFSKTGSDNRAEATAYAARHKLL